VAEADGAQGSNWYVLIAGMPPPTSPLTIAGGITLVPLQKHLSVFDLAAAGAVGFRQWSVLEGIAAACTCEIESALDAAVLPGYDTLNRAWLASALLVLRGFSSHIAPACSGYSWNTIAGHQERSAPLFHEQLQEEGVRAAVFQPRADLPPFRGGMLDFHLQILVHRSRRSDPVNADDAAWLREHFEPFNSLASNDESFRFALQAAHDWRFAKDPRVAVARLWSGIEALFGTGSELVFRISLYCASVLEPRGHARHALFEHVKALYNLRSKVVHGQSLPDKQIQQATDDSFELLSRLLLRIIEIGHTIGLEDLNQAVFF